MTVWRVQIGGGEFEPNLFDAMVADTANPFGNFAVAYVDDQSGDRFDAYPYGTRVDFFYADEDTLESFLVVASGETHTIESADTEQYPLAQVEGTLQVEGDLQLGGEGYQRRFTGYVVERREGDRNGADELEVEAYSFDQFLRRNRVSSDQSGSTIEEALADVIGNDTPVEYVSGNVDVVDNQTLSQSYQGEKIESFLRSVAFKSSDEEFGVNPDVEFFFRPREGQSAPRDIDNSQWLDYDIPEVGAEAINEVTVYFNGGDESVTVDAGDAKLDLQESLNLASPGTQSEDITREDITNIEDAQAVGEQYLQFRNATLAGEVTTFGLNDAEPGDVISIQIDERGVNGDFRIAGNEMRWGEDTNTLDIVEKRGDQDDLLVRMSDTLDRVEGREADRDGVNNRVTSTTAGASIGVTGTIATGGGVDSQSSRWVNDGTQLIRDAWSGRGDPLDIAEIAVGDDESGLSRTNSTLANETARLGVSESLAGSTGVEYTAAFDETDVREVGLFDSAGTMVCRAVFDDAGEGLSGTNDVTVSVDVSNDESVSRGVLTTAGQESVRDIIADNSPALPTQYAYGDGDIAPDESDTGLESEVVTTDLEELLVQDAATDAEWDGIADVPATTPAGIDGAEFGDQQICWTVEGEDMDEGQQTRNDTFTPPENSDYSGGDSAVFARDSDASGGPDSGVWRFEVQHYIPGDSFGAEVRDDDNGNSNGAPAISWYLDHVNGNSYPLDHLSTVGVGLTLAWIDIGNGAYDGTGYGGPDLPPGEYALRLAVDDSDGSGQDYQYNVDAVAPYDARFESDLTFDTDNGGSDGYLDGPELYADLVEVDFAEASTRRTLQNATAEQSWNDTSGKQYIALSNDGGDTFHQTDNAETASATFASAETGVQARIGLSRFGSRSDATPQTGFNGQAVDTHALFADVDAISPESTNAATVRAVIGPNAIVGETVSEAAQLADDDTALTRSIMAEFTVESDQRIESSETITWQTD